jgi:hypothetical protein
VSNIPVLYFLGLYWHIRGSAFLGWVKDDAEYIRSRSCPTAGNRRPTAANRQHPDAGASQEESIHAEPQ